jgi:hypothetical protein
MKIPEYADAAYEYNLIGKVEENIIANKHSWKTFNFIRDDKSIVYVIYNSYYTNVYYFVHSEKMINVLLEYLGECDVNFIDSIANDENLRNSFFQDFQQKYVISQYICYAYK